jgi:DNA polymerase III delta prime subunit
MAEASNKQQKLKVKNLLGELLSGNEAKASASIKALQANGDSSILEPMAALLMTDLSAKIREEIVEFLCSLKDSSAVDEMMRLVNDSDYLPIRQQLLSTIWNSKLDYTYFLPEFVEIAVDGDFMEALECLTIIENMTGPVEERHVLEAKLHLREYLEDTDPKDPQKSQIMSEIAMIIKDFDNMDEDDDIEFFNE